MNSTVDKEMIEEENNIEVAENEIQPQYFDSLNRTDFVKNVIQIIENLSAQKASKCYAIKGTWGVGKTHVLDMIEKELFNEYRQANAYDKYILFHYNAWKYDYYYEPLVSMVASMVESVDEERSFISPALKKKFKGFLNGVFKAFNALNKVRGKQEVFPNGTTSNSENNSSQFFDSNCHLNKTMKKLKEGLGKMSSDVTIIVVVDELDRCLPEYAIKVLERLHHIFNGMENTQVILSVDYDQLENTVKTIFGENTSTKRYIS
jgi:Cdc6-like AAA superfamily ATPase